MIEFGNPPALQYYEEEKFLSITIKKPSGNSSLLDLIKEQLSHIEKAHICLSGGGDSQFALRVLQQLGIPITAHTYLTTWEGAPINSDDVMTAKMLTDRENIELHVTQIELYDFFKDKKHLEYGKKYATASPQIAVHLHYLDTAFKDIDGTVVLGGDVPMLIKDSPHGEGPADIAGLSGSFIMKNTQAYHAVARDNNFDIIKDLLYCTPQIIYKALELSIDIVEKYQMHCEVGDTNGYAHKLKHAIYEEILPGGINPLMKSTGFERLKKYLASQSGIYNTFDLKYRTPMELAYRDMQRDATHDAEFGDSPGTDGTVRYKAGKLPQELSERYRAAIEDNNSKNIYEYYFDF